jgi:hypothetical protein
MPNANDEPKVSNIPTLDRRTVIRSALVVGGVSALGGGVGMAKATPEAVVAEREWARTLARSVADQLPEAARQLPNLGLSSDQVEELRRVFENTLVVNMGCESPSQ